jgi:thiopurine S-methyltransferase
MKHEFWHDKWQKNEIGFHLNQPHSLLVKYIDSLNLEKNSKRPLNTPSEFIL